MFVFPITSPNLFDSNHATGLSTDAIIWSIIELYTAVICACLMAIRPLFTRYLPSIFQTANGFSDAYVVDSNGYNRRRVIELQRTESRKGLTDQDSSQDAAQDRQDS
jgi:hypothetical protein